MDMFTRLRPFAFVLAAGAMLAGAVPAAAAPSAVHQSMAAANTTASSYVADSEECAFLGVINSYRKINGLGSLALSKTLSAAADDHSLDMVRNNYFSHTLADGSSWADNIAAHGYPSQTYRGENIAAGHESAQDTFIQWKNSPPHNANMLSANFNAIGIGRAYGASAAYGWYWTNTFGSVVDGTYSCTPGDGTVTPPPASTRYVIAGGGRTSSSTSSLLAYDNNTTTSWYTTTSGIPRAAYVYFDLGAVKSVSKVQWYFSQSGSADSFRIQVSSDKSSWTTISTRSNGKGAAWESFAWKGQARYVRFYFDNPNKDTVLGYLGEVRIYFLSIAPACLQPSRSAGWTVRPGVVVPGWRL